MNNEQINPSDFIPFDQKENFNKMIFLAEELDLKTKIEISKKCDTVKYTMKFKNRNLFSLKANGKTLEIKPALWNLDSYKNNVEEAGDIIIDVIINAKDCRNCTDKCGGGAKFNLFEKEYYKCIFSGFKYTNFTTFDVDNLCKLIKLENNMRK